MTLKTPGTLLGRLSRRLRFLLPVLLLAGTALLSKADGQTIVESGVLSPTAPTYADPVQLFVTVTSNASVGPTGTITYTVDQGSAQTATLAASSALLPLGTFAPGSHQVVYKYSGNIGTSTSQTTSFTVTDVPFRFIGSEQTVIYNHSGFSAVAVDSQNNALITNSSENNLYKLDPQRNLTVVPTSGLSKPSGITLDGSDNIYIADTGNNRVVMLTPAGVQTTVSFTGLSGPTALAFDRTYANLYVNDLGNGRIVKLILATGVQSTIVSGIDRLTGLVVDFSGNLYIGQHYSYGDGTLFKLDTSGNLTSGYFGARSPDGLARDTVGNLYYSDDYSGLNEVDTQGHFTHIENYYGPPIGVDRAGQVYTLGIYSYVFTPGTAAKFANSGATGLYNGANGAPSNNTVLYQVPYQQTLASVDLSTGANGDLGGVGSPSCEQLAQCSDLVAFGSYYPGLHTGYLTGTLSNKAVVQTNFYGVGVNSNEAFDPGTRATASTTLTSAGGLAESEDHTLYATDPNAKKVYSLGIGGASAPTALAFTGLTQPTQVAVDGSKDVFVLDGTTRILELAPAGTQTAVYTAGQNLLTSITAMALDGSGTLFVGGYVPEIGSAIYAYTPAGNEYLVARLTANPTVLAIDGVGGVYEADATTSTLRRYTYLGGNISLAGPTTLATGFTAPSAITVEPSGTVFLALGSAGTLLQVRPDGTSTTLYSGLGNAGAVVEDGRGVLALIDGSKGTLFLDDRRTGAYVFGNQVVNTTSSPLSGTISNDGNGTLGSIEGLPSDSTFTQVAETGACSSSVPTSLVLGAFCKLDYTFTPPSNGTITESGTEQDSTNTPGSDFTYRSVNFAGIGVAPLPSATLTPATIAFGNVPVGSTSPSQVATLSNSGAAALTITSITLPGSSDFSQTNTCGGTLAKGASCSITIIYSPTTAAQAAATLTVVDNSSPSSTQTSAVTGTGTTVPPTLTPATANFGSQAAATTSAAMVFTLANPNSIAMQQTGITLTGAGAAQFQIASTTCTGTVAARSSCTVNVVFVTGAAANGGATYTATLNIATSLGALSSTLSGSQIAVAQAVLTPAMASFGSVAIGESASQTFTLTNNGTAALPITSAATGSAAFAITSNTCGTSLAAAASCTYSVSFLPTATGAQSATLSVVDSVGTQTSALTGTGLATALSISPATITFPSTATGQTSAAMIATLTNIGNAQVYLTTPTLTDATDFTQANNCSGLLAPGASCTITFTFTPKSSGSLTSTFSIADLNNQSHPVTVVLNGPSAVPVITATLTPSSLSYQATTSTVAYNQTATLTNTSTSALTISSITLSGANPGVFATYLTLPGSCGMTLAAGASCSISIGFTSTTVGTYTATLTITDNATPTTQIVSLIGVVTGMAQAALTPATANFGSVTIGSTTTQTLTLTNAGTAALPITGTAISGTQYSITGGTCGTSLAAGASCTYLLSFTPTAVGVANATFNVTDSVGTQSSALTGTGTAAPAPQAALTPATAGFGSVNLGSTSTQTLTLTNAGTAALVITTNTVTAGPFAVTAKTCSTTLAAGASCTFTLTFTPVAGGTQTATFSVTDAVGTQAATLTGTGNPVTPPDFSITPTPSAQSTYRGQSVTYTIALASLMGANPFTGNVTLTAMGLPSGATASFAPAAVVPGASTVLTVTVPPLSSANTRNSRTKIAFATLIGALLFLRRKRLSPRLVLLLLAFGATSALAGCGTRDGFDIPTSTSIITVTGTSGNVSHSTTVTLTVK